MQSQFTLRIIAQRNISIFNMMDLNVGGIEIHGSIPERIGDMKVSGKSLVGPLSLRWNASFMLKLVFMSPCITEQLSRDNMAMGKTIPNSTT